MTQLDQSKALFEAAKRVIPGGVNSPVRAFAGVGGGTPPFLDAAEGAYVIDVDGNRYIDYVGSWGPMILGHAHPEVVQAAQAACAKGLSFGAPSPLEVELAKAVCARFDSMDRVRMVSSGTEATMSAIRVARGVTGRDKLIKFEGCYHGHSDSLLVKAGSGALTLGVPSSPGVPASLASQSLTATFNDLDSVAALFEQNPKEIACIIVEPVAGNMNLLLPVPGFLKGLRDLCDQYGALLIFDEVMTGFRVGPAGYQSLTDVRPDLTTLAKVLGGGMPVAAYGGRADVIDQIAPLGPIYQAGTLSGNPVAMAAGLATLNLLDDAAYERLEQTTGALAEGYVQRAAAAGVALQVHQICGMLGLFFSEKENITRYEDVLACDQEKFKLFFHHMLEAGVYLAPSAFEAGFISLAHTETEVQATLDAVERAFAAFKN